MCISYIRISCIYTGSKRARAEYKDYGLRQTKGLVRREKKVFNILKLPRDDIKFEYVQRH